MKTMKWIMAAMVAAGTAQAAPKTWTGTTDTNFSTAGNWLPAGFVDADNMYFTNSTSPAGTSLNNDLATNTTVSGFFFSSVNSLGYTLSGNPIKINGAINCAGAINSQTINMDIDLNNGATAVRNITTPVSPASLTLGGTISGPGGIQALAAGTGPLIITGSNTFGGRVSLNAGAICIIRNDNALGSSVGTNTAVASGASLQLENNITVAEPISLKGGSAPQGALQNNNNFTNTLTGLITYDANSTIVCKQGGLMTFDVPSGNAIIGKTYNMDIRGAGNIVINDPISGSGIYLAHGDSGSLTLAAPNTFANQMRVDLGVVIANTLANIGDPSSLGTGSGNPVIRIGWRSNAGGTLRYVGAAASSDRQIQIGFDTQTNYTAGGTVQNNGSGALAFTAAAFNAPEATATAPRTLTLGGTNANDNTISGTLSDNNTASNATVALVKADAGKWILSGNNSYSGGTTVSAGMLVANADGALGTNDVSVADGATLVLQGGTSHNYIGDGADVVLGSNAVLNLNFSGTDTIGTLSLNGGATYLSPGTYTAAALGVSGSGSLHVTAAGTGTGGYATWAAGWGVEIGAASSDYDNDGQLNIYEYGLGGDPTNSADTGTSPVFGTANVGGTNYFSYIHPQLSDPASGLDYHLELNTDLVYGTWTNAGYTVYGTHVTGGDLDFVTNLTTTVDSKKFIRLIIQ